MKKLFLAMIMIIAFTGVLHARDPLIVGDNVECYGFVSSTETSKQALDARTSGTRIKWEIRDDNGAQDLFWYDTAFTTTTINTSFSSHTATASPYKVYATSTTPFTDDYPCYKGAIHIMSLTTPTTFYIIEWWR